MGTSFHWPCGNYKKKLKQSQATGSTELMWRQRVSSQLILDSWGFTHNLLVVRLDLEASSVGIQTPFSQRNNMGRLLQEDP